MSESVLQNPTSLSIIVAIIVVIIIFIVYKNGLLSKSEGFASQPAVVLFTKSTQNNHLACGGPDAGQNDACATYQFGRLSRWYGSINVYQVSDAELNQDIPVGMIKRYPTIAYLPEGPGNFNLVRVYQGPMNTMAIEQWIKTLPAAAV